MRTFRGWKALIHDSIDGVVDLVDAGHESTARAVIRGAEYIEPIAEPVRVVDSIRRVTTRGVLGSIKVVNRLVEAVSNVGLDVAFGTNEPGSAHRRIESGDGAQGGVKLTRAVALRSDLMLSPDVVNDAAIGLANGTIGDQLFAKRNGLDMGLVLRVRDYYVDPDDTAAFTASVREALTRDPRPAGARVAIFAHGLATTEWSWVLEAQAYHGDPAATFGSLLERDLGITPIYVRYNTGRHISSSGRALSAALEQLMNAYPVPIEELVLIGHSMGGLVIRSACHYGAQDKLSWVDRVQRVFCLGSPHQGAPLEKFGHILTSALASVDLPGTIIPAKLLDRRSAGIKDLRHGSLVEQHWLNRDPDALVDEGRREVPLLPNVTYYFVATTMTQDTEHPLGQLIGDLLVRVPSGSGPKLSESTFPIEREKFGGILHHELQNHPQVYEVVRRGCELKPAAGR